ncbi:MAG: response regulator [Kofleriaceae bacterium]
MEAASVLVIDADPEVRSSIRGQLQRCGFAVREATSCAIGMASFLSHRPDVVLVEYRLPDGDGVSLIGQLRATDPDVPCIVLSGHGTIDLAVQAIKEGAEHFVTKPIKVGLLETLILGCSSSKRAASARSSRRCARPAPSSIRSSVPAS